MQNCETRQEQNLDDEPVPSLNASLLSAFRRLKSRKSKANTYDLQVLCDPAPSRSEFEDHNFVRLTERQLGDLVFGFEEEMQRNTAT